VNAQAYHMFWYWGLAAVSVTLAEADVKRMHAGVCSSDGCSPVWLWWLS
jgi:hypothetical protein